ncbi:toxin-antitoxin system, antitoxin component, Xre family [Bacteroides fluxus YIT 12057]|uniref:Toxin-antitoxin system, antitoxin component, Xre family n=1 Tax=Bacteroides fluxus YIT 12057 TaxID=763034 RepID=F3PUK3_9BACE|nr:toxin-antitoxin system, antitoxin component, Xre family [Bacteroides fluxus YIT 12057]
MQRARKSSNHPEFGEFIMKELVTLNLSRESFRDICHMKQAYLEDIKKG